MLQIFMKKRKDKVNKTIYAEQKKADVDFDKKWVHDIDPTTIIFDNKTSQIRQTGHVVTNAAAIAEIIEQKNKDTSWLVPISCHKTLSGEFELKDGATRTLAAIRAGAPKIRCSLYHDSMYANDQWEWTKFQAIGNEHNDIHQSNTKEDIELWISKAYKSGFLAQELGYAYKANPANFLTEGAKWIKENIYPNNPKNTLWMRYRLKDAVCSGPAIAYKNYTEETAIKHFTDYSTTGCVSIDVGPAEATNGISVRIQKGCKRLNPILIGYATHDAVVHPGIKTHVVFYVSDLSTATDESIMKSRIQVQNFYDKFQKVYECFDGLWILPQIKSGKNAENLDTIIKSR